MIRFKVIYNCVRIRIQFIYFESKYNERNKNTQLRNEKERKKKQKKTDRPMHKKHLYTVFFLYV